MGCRFVDEYSTKYLSHVTTGQLVAGLDAFYADLQNRRIRVENAVRLVANQIAGTPTVDEMILNFYGTLSKRARTR